MLKKGQGGVAGRRGALRVGLGLCVCFMLWAPAPMLGQGSRAQYKVKAAFVYNFAKFVEWPASAFAQSDTPLVIGILGDDPFEGGLDDFVVGRRIGTHELRVKHFHAVSEVGGAGCHILFISASERHRLPQILSYLETRSIVTIGDTDGFAEQGGMLGLRVEARNVGFEINEAAARAVGIRISSSLLELAKKVWRGPPQAR